MKQHTGMVTAVRFVDFNQTKLWSFQIDEDVTWYRTGKDKPIVEGDGVTFDEKNAQVVLSSLVVASGDIDTAAVDPVVQEAVDQANRILPGAVRTTGGIDEVGRRIQYQNARRDACNIITAAIAVEISDSKGILPWATNVAKAKKLDLLRGYINELTKQFIEEENNG